jgi:hypothetical protein
MPRHYVDVTNVPDEFLEVMGYCLFEETKEFQLRVFKGDPYILPKEGKRYLYVDDVNDAIMFRARPKVPAPPKTDGSRTTKKRR